VDRIYFEIIALTVYDEYDCNECIGTCFYQWGLD